MIYNTLTEHQMGTKRERMSLFRERTSLNTNEFTSKPADRIVKNNIRQKEPNLQGSQPGNLLAQDLVFIDSSNSLGEIYLQVVIDTYSNYVFGILHTNKSPDHAVLVLHNYVLPFFSQFQLPITKIITNKNRCYCGKETHHFELYLKLHGIEHLRTNLKQFPFQNIIKEFSKTASKEFFRKISSSSSFHSIDALQLAFNQWLDYYNRDRPFNDYPNMS